MTPTPEDSDQKLEDGGQHAAGVVPGPAVWNMGRMWRLMVKELREILRDRRTIITLVLMPLLLYPLLGLAFRQFFLSSVTTPPPFYAAGVASREEAFFLEEFLQYRSNVTLRLPADSTATAPIPFRFVSAPDLDLALRTGAVHLVVRVLTATPGRPTPDRNVRADVETRYVPQFTLSTQALAEFEKQLALANQAFLQQRIKLLLPQIRQTAVPVQVQPEPVEVKAESVTLAALIPVILILMTITGAVYPAIDLTAGERERGTLETLMAAPIPRLGLLFAKYIAVLAVALLTALVNLTMMTVTLLASGLGKLLLGDAGMSLPLVLKVLGLLLLFAGFFSAALLTVASFARSFKEAQAYLIPLTLLSLGPGLLGIIPGIVLTPALAVTPVINIALLARDIFEGKAETSPATIAIVATLVYAAATLALAARVFGAEAVLYQEQASWSDLFRRRAEVRPTPSLGSAFLCLALLLPAYFLVTGFLTQVTLPLGLHFLVLGLANVILVGGLPIAAAKWTNVSIGSGLQLRWPRWPAWLAAILFGASMWPFLYALAFAMQSAVWFSDDDAAKALLQEMIEKWRELPFIAILLVIAVAPAVCEELLFRGYVLNALRPHGRAIAIFGSAVLFGLLHTLMFEMVALERLVATTTLGIILGWLCWRTGSVFPGMVAHGLHNSCMTAVAYYEPRLRELPWLADPPAYLVTACFAAATLGVVMAVCAALLGRSIDLPSGYKASDSTLAYDRDLVP